MCGRFALVATPDAVEALFAADIDPFPPRYNIAPTQPVLMVANGPARQKGSNLRHRQATLVRWGLIPAWAKDPRRLSVLFNARSETAAEKSAFRAAMRHRRALVPASGFYEWRRMEKGRSQAYWVRPRHGGVIGFAGLMESWLEPGGSEMDTGAILTTAANDDLSAIHERMPVVIRPEDHARWLDCIGQEPRDVADLLQPVEPGFFEAIPVSDGVNKVENTSPDIQERIDPAPAGEEPPPETPPGQLSLF